MMRELINMLRKHDYTDADAEDAADCIEQLEAERQWISVEDRLPDKDGRYLIMIFNEHQPDQGSWIECEDWFGEWSRIYHATVTHWMPLPTPPEEKDDVS